MSPIFSSLAERPAAAKWLFAQPSAQERPASFARCSRKAFCSHFLAACSDLPSPRSERELYWLRFPLLFLVPVTSASMRMCCGLLRQFQFVLESSSACSPPSAQRAEARPKP